MNTIVLTGGTSKRFGSDKSQAQINGKSLLQILTDGLTELIIVGPETFATDMPFAPRVLPELHRALSNDAALPIDCEGYLQPLAGLYRTAKLSEVLATFDSLENISIMELIKKLDIDSVEISECQLLIDIDTKAELVNAIDLASRLGL